MMLPSVQVESSEQDNTSKNGPKGCDFEGSRYVDLAGSHQVKGVGLGVGLAWTSKACKIIAQTSKKSPEGHYVSYFLGSRCSIQIWRSQSCRPDTSGRTPILEAEPGSEHELAQTGFCTC